MFRAPVLFLTPRLLRFQSAKRLPLRRGLRSFGVHESRRASYNRLGMMYRDDVFACSFVTPSSRRYDLACNHALIQSAFNGLNRLSKF